MSSHRQRSQRRLRNLPDSDVDTAFPPFLLLHHAIYLSFHHPAYLFPSGNAITIIHESLSSLSSTTASCRRRTDGTLGDCDARTHTLRRGCHDIRTTTSTRASPSSQRRNSSFPVTSQCPPLPVQFQSLSAHAHAPNRLVAVASTERNSHDLHATRVSPEIRPHITDPLRLNTASHYLPALLTLCTDYAISILALATAQPIPSLMTLLVLPQRNQQRLHRC